MVIPELETYVKTARGRGMSDDAIRSALLGMNWDRAIVEEALGTKTTVTTSSVVKVSSVASHVASTGSRKKSWLKFAIIGLVAVFVLGGGAFAYSFFLKQQVAAPVETPAAPVEIPVSNEPTSTAVVATTTPSSTPPVVAPKPAPVGGTNTGKVKAVISVQTNYQGDPLKILGTCTVGTSKDIFGTRQSFGDGFEGGSESSDPVPHTETFDYTYKYAGQFSLYCVPVYGDEPQGMSWEKSPYRSNTQTIQIGGRGVPSGKDLTLTFQPLSGTLPSQIQTSCTSVAPGTEGMGIKVDYGSEPGQRLADKNFPFIYPQSTYNVSFSGIIQGDALRGARKVICTAFGPNFWIESDPVYINFQ